MEQITEIIERTKYTEQELIDMIVAGVDMAGYVINFTNGDFEIEANEKLSIDESGKMLIETTSGICRIYNHLNCYNQLQFHMCYEAGQVESLLSPVLETMKGISK